jgi:hypothetical protein
MHQSLQGATFHVEHVIPHSKGGPSTLDNLALACPGCNLRKADRIEAVDPLGGSMTPLFHPRRERWSDHFDWKGTEVVCITTCGRATAALLDLNHPRRLRIRQAEARFGLFPPPGS